MLIFLTKVHYTLRKVIFLIKVHYLLIFVPIKMLIMKQLLTDTALSNIDKFDILSMLEKASHENHLKMIQITLITRERAKRVEEKPSF